MRSVLDKLRREDFQPRVGAAFRVALESGDPLELTLIEARDLTLQGRPPANRRMPFSLLFRGPRSPVLPQRIYALEDPGLGRLEIFLVPIGTDGDGVRYEAIFN